MSSITDNIKGGPPTPYPLPAQPPPARSTTGIGKVPINDTQPPTDTTRIPPPWH